MSSKRTYYQNVATLTCGSGAFAGSGMGGTDPLRGSVYWPSFTEAVQREVVSTHKLTNRNRSRHVVVKNETPPLLQLGQNTATYVDLNNQQPRYLRVLLWATALRNTVISPLVSLREAGLWTSLLSLRNNRSWIWTACRSPVFPVDGLQRRCRTRLLSSFWELVGSGRTSLYM